MHGWVATGQEEDADSQADIHKEEASLSSLPSSLLLQQAHHVGLAPPYKIPRGSGSAEEELPSSMELQLDSGTVHGPFS